MSKAPAYWLSVYEPHIASYGVVYPVHDLVNHEVFAEGCVCGPTLKEMTTPKGNHIEVLFHHSLDGREREENFG